MESHTSAALLQRAGIKATVQRTAVLDALRARHAPQSVADIAKTLPRVDQVTIYRSLELFVRAGIATEVSLQNERAYFEYRDASHHHHHLVCRSCGRIEDVEMCGLDAMSKAIVRQSRQFRSISSHSLEFFGLCVQCDR